MTAKTETYVIASHRPWNRDLPEHLSVDCDGNFVLIDEKNQLTKAYLDSLSPRFIFVPHWSRKIPPSIYENYECIIFHMTDVPFGRGGSPLQNLIIRGHTETIISALRCTEEVDAGPVYLKRPLLLYGSAEEVFLRASKLIQEMIVEIIEENPHPVSQQGEVVYFERRRPEDGNLERSETLEEVYDTVRMLDAVGYPHAYIEFGTFRMEFTRASQHVDGIHADVIIKRRR